MRKDNKRKVIGERKGAKEKDITSIIGSQFVGFMCLESHELISVSLLHI